MRPPEQKLHNPLEGADEGVPGPNPHTWDASNTTEVIPHSSPTGERARFGREESGPPAVRGFQPGPQPTRRDGTLPLGLCPMKTDRQTSKSFS